jgi:hypothetical protein
MFHFAFCFLFCLQCTNIIKYLSQLFLAFFLATLLPPFNILNSPTPFRKPPSFLQVYIIEIYQYLRIKPAGVRAHSQRSSRASLAVTSLRHPDDPVGIPERDRVSGKIGMAYKPTDEGVEKVLVAFQELIRIWPRGVEIGQVIGDVRDLLGQSGPELEEVFYDPALALGRRNVRPVLSSLLYLVGKAIVVAEKLDDGGVGINFDENGIVGAGVGAFPLEAGGRQLLKY